MKQGDKVVCNDVLGFDMSHLMLGKVYEVSWTDGVNVKLAGVQYTTKTWRFSVARGFVMKGQV